MEQFKKRIKRLDDHSKLYAELKNINRALVEGPREDMKEWGEKKKIVEERLNELLFVTL